jgi:hypothetical protein
MSEGMKILIVPPPCLKTVTGQKTPESLEKTRQLFAKLAELASLLWRHFLACDETETVELLKIDRAYQDANDFYGVSITLILRPSQAYRSVRLEAFWRLPDSRLEIGLKLADDKNETKKDRSFPAQNAEEASKVILTYLFKYFSQNATLLSRFAEDLIPKP